MIDFPGRDTPPASPTPPAGDPPPETGNDSRARYIRLELTSTALQGGKTIELKTIVSPEILTESPINAFPEAMMALGFRPEHIRQFCSLARLAERPADEDVPQITLQLYFTS